MTNKGDDIILQGNNAVLEVLQAGIEGLHDDIYTTAVNASDIDGAEKRLKVIASDETMSVGQILIATQILEGLPRMRAILTKAHNVKNAKKRRKFSW